jgi:cytochrome c553
LLGASPARGRVVAVVAAMAAPSVLAFSRTPMAALALETPMSAARGQAVAAPQDTVAARVQACVPCHGPDGQGTSDVYFPRLAGKPAGYLFNQLAAFRDGRRHYPPMHYLLEYLPPQYLQEIADYFASQHPPFLVAAAPEANPDVLARGETLVVHGDSAHEIPPCSSCHGASLAGMEPAIPSLLGLRASYISAQVGAWRYGTRTAIAPDCMQIVAGLLSEDDVRAVGAYLSSRPAWGPPPSPAAKGSWELPLACGSEPQ